MENTHVITITWWKSGTCSMNFYFASIRLVCIMPQFVTCTFACCATDLMEAVLLSTLSQLVEVVVSAVCEVCRQLFLVVF